MSSGEMLVAAPLGWDEACFAAPALRALVASGLSVGILCPAEQKEFWRTIPGLAAVDFTPAEKPKQIADHIAGSWQASLAFEPGPAADAFQAAGIRRRLGWGDKSLANRLTHPMKYTSGPLEHRVRHYLSAVEEMGIPTARLPYFAPADLGIAPIAGTVLCCPGSDFGPNHEWPLDRWEQIIGALLRSDRKVTIAIVDGATGLPEALSEKFGDAVETFHAAPLGGTLPVLAIHGLVIAADGSLPHLAAHAGSTCITLFGPNDAGWKRPLGRRHAVVKRHVECAPCLLSKCPLDLRCQNELDVRRVIAAIREKLIEVESVMAS